MAIATSFEFTLVLDGVSELTDEITDAVYDAGCDDSLPVSTNGKVFLDFIREAPTYDEAINSAISSLRSAGFMPELLTE